MTAAVCLVALLGGCATQADYEAPALNLSGTALARAPVSPGPDAAGWWSALDDPAVDVLAARALAASPDVDRAAAVIEEARALLSASAAARGPGLGLNLGASRADGGPETATGGQSSAQAGLALAWEIDLFGRLREAESARARRLEARIADGEAVRLALAADTADAVISLRACGRSLEAVEAEIASRRTVLALTILRRDAGLDADIDVALSETGLEAARTTLALRRQECATLLNALVLLTGADRQEITAVLAHAPEQPAGPAVPSVLPATVLRTSPLVVAAERDLAAAWSDIAVARAARLPKIDLSAALTGQWLSALGSGEDSLLSSVGASLGVPLFDGGAGAASVVGGEARYAAAVADLDGALRLAARDVENALAARRSAQDRQISGRRAVAAADAVLAARETQWRAGAVSQFEVEEARRQLAAARDSQIAASRDAAQAWVALVRAAGPNLLQESPLS